MAQLKSTNVTGNLSVTGNILASQIIKFGGTEEQFLMANGSTKTKSELGIGSGNGSVTSVAISNGGGLSVSGSPITSAGTITISHANTSSQDSVTTGGRNYINSITLDEYGHVTALSTGTETVADTKVKQTVVGDTYYYKRPLLFGDTSVADTTANPSFTTVTGESYISNKLYAIPKTGEIFAGKATVNGNITLHADSGNSPKLVFERGDAKGDLTDWNIDVSAGELRFNTVKTSGSTEETAAMTLHYDNGLTAAAFKKSGSSDAYVLLAGGGTKALTDFAVSSVGDSYLPLAGGAMTGAGPITYPTASGDNKNKNYISAGGGYAVGSGKEGLKILALEQSDATMGLGVDLTGGPYELTVATSRKTNATASKIAFATHTVGTTAYKTLATLLASGAENPVVTLNVNGTVQAKGFEHTNLTAASGKTKNDYVLLAGGGTKAISDITGTNVSVTAEDMKTTRYPTFVVDCATKGQSLKVDDDVYYTSDNYNWSSFNIGKSTGNGIFTLHRYTKGTTDHFINIAIKDVLSSDYTVYLPLENNSTLATQTWTRTWIGDNITSANNGTINIETAGKGLEGGGDFDLNQDGTETITIELKSAKEGNRAEERVVIAAAKGQINSEKYAITDDSNTVKASWQYNTSTDCVELAWV